MALPYTLVLTGWFTVHQNYSRSLYAMVIASRYTCGALKFVYTALSKHVPGNDYVAILNQCSRGRGAWLLMALTAFALEMVALWFQHVMGLKPCVLCIYERCALFGIMGAGLVGAIAPKSPLRYAAIAIWLYSAGKGIALAREHTNAASPVAVYDLRFCRPLPELAAAG